MRPVCRADLPVPLSWNLGNLTSWNPLGHSRPVMGLIYLLYVRSLFAPTKCTLYIQHTPTPYFSYMFRRVPRPFQGEFTCSLLKIIWFYKARNNDANEAKYYTPSYNWQKRPPASISLSVCSSFRPHGTTRVSLDRFSWHSIFEHFSKKKTAEKIQHLPKKNSVALVRERTVPTERPPPVGEVSTNFLG